MINISYNSVANDLHANCKCSYLNYQTTQISKQVPLQFKKECCYFMFLI